MGLSVTQADYGSRIVGQFFTFEAPGDVLEWHEHGFDSQHIVIVLRGEFCMEVKGEEPQTIRAGEVIDTGPGICHQFTALTADAKLFNICKETMDP